MSSLRSDLQRASGESDLRGRRTAQTLALPISEELLDALADELDERLQERRRWTNIEETADYLGLSVKQVRGLKERHPEIATRVGKRLVFDLLKVAEVLEQRRGHSA